MKKLLLFLSLAAIFVGLAACNNDDNGQAQRLKDNEIEPVRVSDDIAAFFNDNKTLNDIGRSVDFGFDPYASFAIDGEGGFSVEELPYVGGCVMINNASELPTVAPDGTPLNYPDIDFTTHTLIIGVFMDSGGDCVVSQRLTVGRGVAVLDITIGKVANYQNGIYPLMTMPAYFWGIYEKTIANSVTTNVTNTTISKK